MLKYTSTATPPCQGLLCPILGNIFVHFCCARTATIVDIPMVVTAWSSVGITCVGVTFLMRVVDVMATVGACGSHVSERHVPATRETLVPIIEHLVIVGWIPSSPCDAFCQWW